MRERRARALEVLVVVAAACACDGKKTDAPLPGLTAQLPKTLIEERASEGKKPYEYEPEPGDEKGYSPVAMEF